MNADIIILSLAEIPLLDWSGPSFLMFYGLAYFIALAASRRRARNALRPFENQNAPAGLEPYETAYLSGGPNRVTQMAVSKLILGGAAVWKQKFSGAHLIAVDGAKPRGLQPVEQRLWNQLAAAGSKGMRISLLGGALQPDFTALEMRLAIRGLRPAAGERSSAAFAAVWPLLILLAVGVVKLMVGISRDRPVLFLFFLLILTVITAVIVAGKVPRITGTGERVLKDLRGKVPAQVASYSPHTDTAFMSFALFGPTAFEDVPGFEKVSEQMEKHMAPPASRGADSSGGSCGSGCSSSSGSSGCSSGSSGCGGGGCGGCGGS